MHEKRGQTESITFWMTPEEKEEITRRAKKHKLTVSRYLRWLGLGKMEERKDEQI